MNNFQRLMEQEEERSPQPPNIQHNVENTLGIFRFIGQIVEVYLPKVADMFVTMAGGNESQQQRPTNAIGNRKMPHDRPNVPRRGPNKDIGNTPRG